MAGMQIDLDKVMRTIQAKLASKAAAEPKIILKRPRSVVDIIEQIEARGMPTDLSPRIKKPIDLPLEAFESRPRVSSLPAPAVRRMRLVK